MAELLRFSYWSDPLCVWALVAHSKLERLLQEVGRCLEVDYRVVPVFGSVPWRFREGPWAEGGVEERVKKTREIAESHGVAGVSGECWRRAMPASCFAPGAAIKAVCMLEEAEHAAAGVAARYQHDLRRAFFVEERNIATRRVQLEVAEALSLSRAQIEPLLDDGSALARVWEDYQEKERLRIQGSPTYVFDGGRTMLYGNFAYGILRATVNELLEGLHPGGSPC